MTEFGFVSSGDPEKDEREARGILRTEYLLEHNRCPNDATELAQLTLHDRECPRCGFAQYITSISVESIDV